MKIISSKLSCPRCFSKKLYKYGKDLKGNQKYQCTSCRRQWAPAVLANPRYNKNYPPCPMCNGGSFLHHDYEHYSNFRCNNRKKCNHSFFVVKKAQIQPSSSQNIELEEFSLKGMRYPFHVVLTALILYFIGNSTLRKVSETLKLAHNIDVSHVSIHKWIKRFAPAFINTAEQYKEQINLADSDEWHFDETYVKISGKWYYLWWAIDSETRMILDFHLSPTRDASAAYTLTSSCKERYGCPRSMIVSDRFSAYNQAFKFIMPSATHLKVEDFADPISNNLIEAFNGQFKAWYKAKRGFKSFESANTYIALYIFFYNFIRPHQSLSNLTPAQVAGANYGEKQRRACLLIS